MRSNPNAPRTRPRQAATPPGPAPPAACLPPPPPPPVLTLPAPHRRWREGADPGDASRGAPTSVLVRCEGLDGIFYPLDNAIEFEGAVLGPTEFEKRAGRGMSRNWRKSIFVVENGRAAMQARAGGDVGLWAAQGGECCMPRATCRSLVRGLWERREKFSR